MLASPCFVAPTTIVVVVVLGVELGLLESMVDRCIAIKECMFVFNVSL